MTGESTDLFTVRDDGTWAAFICTCSEEGIIEAGKLKQEVRRLLSEGRTRPCTVSNLLTCVVISLNWEYRAYISFIGNDLWSMVIATADNGFEVRVNCDQVEDGIAAAWYAFWLRKKEADGDRGAEAGTGGGGGERAVGQGHARPDREPGADGPRRVRGGTQ